MKKKKTVSSIPYDKFKKVNDEKKALAEKVAAFEKLQKEANDKKLAEEGKYKELLEAKGKELDNLKSSIEEEKASRKKDNLLNKIKLKAQDKGANDVDDITRFLNIEDLIDSDNEAIDKELNKLEEKKSYLFGKKRKVPLMKTILISQVAEKRRNQNLLLFKPPPFFIIIIGGLTLIIIINMSDFIFSSITGSSFSKRDVDNLLYQTIQNSPTLIGLIQGREFSAGTGINVFNPISNSSNKASATTFEWYERVLGPKKASLTAIAGTTTTFTVADSSIFRIEDILRIETAAGKEVKEQVIVTAIPSATTLTVTRNYNGVGTTDLQDGNEVIYLISPRVEEGSGSAKSENINPTPVVNYTQIFKDSARVTKLRLQLIITL